jgi:hypothetical protein
MDVMNWRKSSHSGGNGAECIETAAVPGTVLLRDSKDQDGPKLSFGLAAWAAFTAALKA